MNLLYALLITLAFYGILWGLDALWKWIERKLR